MAKEIHMPKLGMSMLDGEIGRWLIKEGDKVNKGDEIVEVIVNKAAVTVQSMVTGTLEKIVVNEGETAEVGAVIAVVADE